MALSTQPYKGARDFYPEDKRLQKYIFSKLRQTVEKFGYEEYETPIIEPIEIFSAKTGDEIISEQTYSFEDRGGRKVVIRPEMTPSVSRIVAARRQELAYPLRWYSIADNWRYERPQRGRMRQFYQLNVDLFGIESLEADIEIIQIADAILKSFGADRSMYNIEVNSRRAMEELLEGLGYSGEIVTRIIGLFDRLGKDSYKTFLKTNFSVKDARKLENFIFNTQPDSVLNTKAGSNLKALIGKLKDFGINVEPNLKLNRGFEYYTDVVFEVFDSMPENNRSLFGGGRYDGLVGLFGVEPLPAVGFAMGDVTLVNFLESHQLLPTLQTETDIYAIAVGNYYDKAQRVVSKLRDMGVNVAASPTSQKIDKAIKTAVKKGIPYVLFIGEKELRTEQYTLRDLKAGTEDSYSLLGVVNVIKNNRRTK